MIDLIFPEGDELPFHPIAKKIGIDLLSPLGSGGLANVGIYPQTNRARLLLAKATPSIRAQVEQSPVDGFFGVELLSDGVNHVLLSLLAKKNMMILFLLRHLFTSENQKKVLPLEKMIQLIPLCRKYHVQIVLASGAKNPYELRSPHDMMALALSLGMTPKETTAAFSLLHERILYNDRKRKGEILRSGIIIQQ